MAQCIRIATLVFLLNVVLLCTARAEVDCAERSGKSATSAREAAAYLTEAFRRRNLPAAAAIIVHDGRPSFINFGRTADGRPMSEDTAVYIGSMSKAFTAAAVLQLAEHGLVDLDAPVSRYVPEFRLADARGVRITVRQMLNQTSGMSVATDHEWSAPQPKTLSEAVIRLRKASLAADPGSLFSYHNPNYTVLAQLVEKVSGQSFADYLREHLFAPLGMLNTTTVDRVRETLDGAAPGHIRAFGRFFPASSPAFFVNGAGGVLTTPRDYAQWLLAQLQQGQAPGRPRVLTLASIQASHTPGPHAQEYGFGWNRRGARVSHSGGLPNHASYVALEGCDAVALFSPVPPVAAPLRDIALEGLQALRTKPPRVPSQDNSIWLDSALVLVSLGTLLMTARSVSHAKRWAYARRDRRHWRTAMGLTPALAVLALILIAIPWSVSRVISWSWVWLWFYVPVWVVTLATFAAGAAAVLVARCLSLVIPQTGRVGVGLT